MRLLSKKEFYQRIGQALRVAREKRGLSHAQAAELVNRDPIDKEQCLRFLAALGLMAGHIRQQKKLTRKQVAERGNLSVQFVREMEDGKILHPESYSIYCLSYGLRMSYSVFIAKVERLSRTPLDEHDRPIRQAAHPKRS